METIPLQNSKEKTSPESTFNMTHKDREIFVKEKTNEMSVLNKKLEAQKIEVDSFDKKGKTDQAETAYKTLKGLEEEKDLLNQQIQKYNRILSIPAELAKAKLLIGIFEKTGKDQSAEQELTRIHKLEKELQKLIDSSNKESQTSKENVDISKKTILENNTTFSKDTTYNTNDRESRIAAAIAAAETLESQKKEESNLEVVSREDDYVGQVDSIRKSIAWMKESSFSTPSMIAREERKLQNLIENRKIDSLEAELIKEDSKKGNIEKALGSYNQKVIEKFRNYKENTRAGKSFVEYTEKMNSGKPWQRFAKRALVAGVFGAVGGAIGIVAGAGLATAGVAGLAGAGFSVTRMAASVGAGSITGLAHKALTKKGVQENTDRYTSMYDTEIDTKLTEKLEVDHIVDGRKLDARNREYLNELREKRNNPEKLLTKKENEALNAMENIRKEHTLSYLRSKDNYKELINRVRTQNERNNAIASSIAGLVVGLGSGVSGLRAETIDSIVGGGTVIQNLENPLPEGIVEVQQDIEPAVTTVIEDVDGGTLDEILITAKSDGIPSLTSEGVKFQNLDLTSGILSSELVQNTIEIVGEKPSAEIISGDIFIKKGEGITHAFLRQLEANQELRDHLPSGADAFSVAKELGYIGENDEVRVNFGKGAGYELKLEDGKLICVEHLGGSVNSDGNYVGGEIHETHASGQPFEGKGIEDRSTSQNYEYIQPRGTFETNQPETILTPIIEPPTVTQTEAILTPLDKEIVPKKSPLDLLNEEVNPIKKGYTEGVIIGEQSLDTGESVDEPKELTDREKRQARRAENKRMRQERRMARIKSGKGGGWLEKAALFLTGAGVGYGVNDIIEDGGSGGSSTRGNIPPVYRPTEQEWGGRDSGSK
jgi:hypothetical protein